MSISIVWDEKSSEEPFQEILDVRIGLFSHEDCHRKLRSGMTRHQEWMLSVGIRFKFPENAVGRRFYDVTTRGWQPGLNWRQFKADALLVPEILYLKTLFLGRLP